MIILIFERVVGHFSCRFVVLTSLVFLQWIQQSIRNITEDVSNRDLAYLTHEDLCSCFEGDTLLAVQAPTGTQLEVPIPESAGPGRKRLYQIHLKSSEGQIYVLLVNKDAADAEPMVVPVPLPKEMSEALARTEEDETESEEAKRSRGRGKVRLPTRSYLFFPIPHILFGVQQVKAASPAEAPAFKRPRREAAKQEQAETDELSASSEVAGIMTGGLPSEIPGLEDLISTESECF
jgi:hypothetical protein